MWWWKERTEQKKAKEAQVNAALLRQDVPDCHHDQVGDSMSHGHSLNAALDSVDPAGEAAYSTGSGGLVRGAADGGAVSAAAAAATAALILRCSPHRDSDHARLLPARPRCRTQRAGLELAKNRAEPDSGRYSELQRRADSGTIQAPAADVLGAAERNCRPVRQTQGCLDRPCPVASNSQAHPVEPKWLGLCPSCMG